MLPSHTQKVQSGFSLIEVLISLIVLSIGLLGLGGLHLTSLQSSNNAHFRTAASIAATELADRMRLNPSAVSAALYEGEVNRTLCSSSSTVKSCDGDNLCSSTEAAAFDLQLSACGRMQNGERNGGVFYQLPNSTLSISCGEVDCDSGIEHTISIEWNEVDDSDEDNDVQTRSYELNFIP
ncbi:type IV pilus modification protein PilV [Leucothrix sargassi]|nr:type IV pilus modification protein PilV [Leucothrix sargassi]